MSRQHFASGRNYVGLFLNLKTNAVRCRATDSPRSKPPSTSRRAHGRSFREVHGSVLPEPGSGFEICSGLHKFVGWYSTLLNRGYYLPRDSSTRTKQAPRYLVHVQALITRNLGGAAFLVLMISSGRPTAARRCLQPGDSALGCLVVVGSFSCRGGKIDRDASCGSVHLLADFLCFVCFFS